MKKNLKKKNILYALTCIFIVAVIGCSYVFELWGLRDPVVMFGASVSIVLLYFIFRLFGPQKIIHIAAFTFFSFACIGCLFYLLSGIKISSEVSFLFIIFFLSFVYIILYSLYFFVLYSKLSKLSKNLLQSLIVSISILPLIAYCSFDLNTMLILLEKYFTGYLSYEDYWGNRDIINIYAKFGLKTLFVFVCFYFMLSAAPRPGDQPGISKKFILISLSALAAIVFSIILHPTFHHVKIRNFDKYKMLVDEMATRQNPLDQPKYTLLDNSSGGLYFFIFGESHNYEPSMDLAKKYDTFLAKVHNDPDYVCFSDVYSLRNPKYSGYLSFTEHCICHMVSSATQNTDLTYLYKNLNLMDILKKSGYKTLWLANIGHYSYITQNLKILYKMSDYAMVNYTGSFNKKYDDKGMQIDREIPGVLTKLYNAKTLDPKRSFMFIKLMGLHCGEIRYPEEFKIQHSSLSNKELGLLYNDQSIEKIFSVLKSFPETKLIVYCSDHSDSADGKTKLTMFIYLSPDFQRENPQLKQRLQDKADKKFMTPDMYYLFLDMMNIKVKQKSL